MMRRRLPGVWTLRVASLALTIAGATTVGATTADAQGNISMLGFGYPVNGQSVRSAGTAGALGEFDVQTPRNPSSLTSLSRGLLSLQTEPEFRTLTYNSVKESNRVQRIPLVMGALRLNSRAVVSFSSSSFLDRNFSTVSDGQAVIAGTVLPTRDISDMRGSISDLRLGVGYRVNSRVSVGVGGHVFTGSNRLDLIRRFPDSTGFGAINEVSGIQFFGKALSFGTTVLLPKGFSAAASYRAGGTIEADNGDTVVTKATIPDRLSGGLFYRIPGAVFAANLEQNKWSSMQSLGTGVTQAHDATNWSTGTEIETGRIRGTPVLVRAGAGQNTLPFGVNNAKVTEMRYSAGVGFAVTNPGRDQSVLEFSVTRADRKLGASTAKEGAWLLGIGIQIRP
ncbi:MAG: hypothetical protein ACO1Q7_14770 [Gemmatimonas sp.]